MGTYVTLGKHTGATPDGRRRGERLADGMSPSHFVRPKGVTAAHLSVSRIDGTRMINGVTYIQKMNVSHLLKEREVRKWAHLVRAFVKIGGLCVQYLVANAEELKIAKKFHFHLFTCTNTLAAGRYGEDTIGPDQTHNRACPPAYGSDHGFLPDQAEFNPDKIFNSDL